MCESMLAGWKYEEKKLQKVLIKGIYKLWIYKYLLTGSLIVVEDNNLNIFRLMLLKDYLLTFID